MEINLIEVRMILDIMMSGNYSYGSRSEEHGIITDNYGNSHPVKCDSFERAALAYEAFTREDINKIMAAKSYVMGIIDHIEK